MGPPNHRLGVNKADPAAVEQGRDRGEKREEEKSPHTGGGHHVL